MKTRRKSWQLQEAKNQLSELVDAAVNEGPQVITRRGTETAVVISFETWTRLEESRGPLIELLRRAPRMKGGLQVERQRDLGRRVDL